MMVTREVIKFDFVFSAWPKDLSQSNAARVAGGRLGRRAVSKRFPKIYDHFYTME